MIDNVSFLRYLIDFIDSKKESGLTNIPTQAPNIIINVDKDDQPEEFEQDTQPEEVDSAMDRDDVFIPPLQAKLEIMKKLAGIEGKNQELLASEADEDEPFGS